MATKSNINKRWLYLISGVFTMLFSGVLYAWSILKIPFKEVFRWSDKSLALNFTLTMCFFCLGGFLGSLLIKKISLPMVLISSGILSGLGFVFTSMLTGKVFLLYNPSLKLCLNLRNLSRNKMFLNVYKFVGIF